MKKIIIITLITILLFVASVFGVYCCFRVYASWVENGYTVGSPSIIDPDENLDIYNLDLSNEVFYDKGSNYELKYLSNVQTTFNGEENKFNVFLNDSLCDFTYSTAGMLYAEKEIVFNDYSINAIGSTKLKINFKFNISSVEVVISATRKDYSYFKEYLNVYGLNIKIIKGSSLTNQQFSTDYEGIYIKFADKNGYIHKINYYDNDILIKLKNVDFPVVNKEGYNFLGWSYNGYNSIPQEDLDKLLENSVTLYPVFEDISSVESIGLFNENNELVYSWGQLLFNNYLIIDDNGKLQKGSNVKELNGVLVLSNNVKLIDENTFAYCDNLSAIYIPDSVEIINADNYMSSPFYACPFDLKIYCESMSKKNGWSEFWNYGGTSSVYSVKYGYSVEEFFEDIKSSSIELFPDYGSYYFMNDKCYQMSSWESLKNEGRVVVENGVLTHCDFGWLIYISNEVTSIADNAFKDCTSLEAVIIPKGVKSIGANAFNNCSSLKTIYIEGNDLIIGAESISQSPFYNCSADLNIYCKSSTTLKTSSDYWNYITENSVANMKYSYTITNYIYEVYYVSNSVSTNLLVA